jgi:choline dehydrogenase-like flavoprotein
MFLLSFVTRTFRPPHRVDLRSAVDGWLVDRGGSFRGDAWVFELDEARYGPQLEFKFILDGARWGPADGNLRLEVDPGEGATFDEMRVRFQPGEDVDFRVERPAPAGLGFAPTWTPGGPYDVIVIGSGAGGGVLADQLSDRGKSVLVLEAGSYLFPTHVGNLPRQHIGGVFDKHVWGLWDEFKVTNYVNEPGSEYAGGQGFNLGGRSLFWGGLAPRMAAWELEPWPPEIAAYLLSSGYTRAERIMHAAPQTPSQLQANLKAKLAEVLPEYDHEDAQIAVEYRGLASSTLPAGLFSTADLLLESRLSAGPAVPANVDVRLNHLVLQAEHHPGHASAVVARDLASGHESRFEGGVIVLAGGTIESAKLALASGIAPGGGKVGRGITDHPVLFTHFTLPAGSPWAPLNEASKTISRHRQASTAANPFNVVLELGADFNQGRYVDPDLIDQLALSTGTSTVLMGEIVFLLNAPLMEDNAVLQHGPVTRKATVRVARSTVPPAARTEIERVHDAVLATVGAQPLGDRLRLGDVGGVAHEVGSLRMGDAGSSAVDSDLRVHGFDNLYVCDLSVFPTSPAANPTLTLVALADRLAERLART